MRANLGRAIFGAATLALTFPAQAAPQQEFRWEGVVAQGKTVEIKGINGSVTATAAPGNRVTVEARKEAKRGDPEDVRIQVVEHAGGVTVCAVYPAPPGHEPNECRPGESGRMSVRNNDTSVHFTVQVPSGVRFRGSTVNGGVRATGLRGDVDARTVNGDIEVGTSGSAAARTVNGSIDAALGRLGSSGLEFRTVNGGIRLVLPDGAGAEVRAETVNGDVSSDFPLTPVGGEAKVFRHGPRKLRGTIGGGGVALELKTVNGSIALKRAS